MSNNLNKKLLAEAFDAIVNDNDAAKAARLFKRHWDLAAKNSYALLESADEDFEISDMGDDFNNEVADEMGTDAEEKFNQAQVAVDELEDKFPAEVTDEIKAKFDDLRNAIDEMKLAGEEEKEESSVDASVALEDIKGEFEMAGEVSEEVQDLLDEISAAINGAEADVEAEEDVADEELESDELLGEAEDEEIADEFVDEEPSEEVSEEEPSEEVSEEDKLEEIKYTAEDLVALINELDDSEEDEVVAESFTKISDPRKKMTSEEEGVNKKGTMNFGKLPGLKLNAKAGLNMDGSADKSAKPAVKVKTEATPNNGAKSWHKVEKPANKPAASKSMMGK